MLASDLALALDPVLPDRQAGLGLPAVTITAGFTPWYDAGDGSFTVLEHNLEATVAVLLEQRRLLIRPSLPLAELLTRELQAFERRVTPAGSDTYAAGRHGHQPPFAHAPRGGASGTTPASSRATPDTTGWPRSRAARGGYCRTGSGPSAERRSLPASLRMAQVTAPGLPPWNAGGARAAYGGQGGQTHRSRPVHIVPKPA